MRDVKNGSQVTCVQHCLIPRRAQAKCRMLGILFIPPICLVSASNAPPPSPPHLPCTPLPFSHPARLEWHESDIIFKVQLNTNFNLITSFMNNWIDKQCCRTVTTVCVTVPVPVPVPTVLVPQHCLQNYYSQIIFRVFTKVELFSGSSY